MPADIYSGNLINNRYQIQKVLGYGGFRRTYLALDNHRFGDSCVLIEFVGWGTVEDTDQKSRELFEREAKVLHHINHPQIPKFLACFTENERLFIVQEYIDGKTYSELLQERLSQQNQAFSEAEVIQWLMDLLPVFDYLHEQKIIHRDVSLDNLILPNDQSKPVLSDFGLVQEEEFQIWSLGTVLGKIGYTPPEQLRIGNSYPSSDLYALGVCAIVLLSGKMPSLLMDRSLEWQWRSYVNISDCLASILDKMLVEKPTQRYQSAKEILVDIQQSSLPKETEVSEPLKKVEINIDQVQREQEVAEVTESDEFKIVEQQVLKLSEATENNSELQFEAQTSQPSTFSGETKIVEQTESVVVAGELVQDVTQQANLALPVIKNSTQIQQVTAYLIHVQTDRQIELPQNLSAIRIGRADNGKSLDVDVSVLPNSEVVSRTHAVIHVEAGSFYIEDEGSTNGTYVDKMRLLLGNKYRLKSGDYICLGQEELVKFLFKTF
ncbi:hypothetical protein NUACC26_001640 [Scytonema sp. NUACC26]